MDQFFASTSYYAFYAWESFKDWAPVAFLIGLGTAAVHNIMYGAAGDKRKSRITIKSVRFYPISRQREVVNDEGMDVVIDPDNLTWDTLKEMNPGINDTKWGDVLDITYTIPPENEKDRVHTYRAPFVYPTPPIFPVYSLEEIWAYRNNPLYKQHVLIAHSSGDDDLTDIVSQYAGPLHDFYRGNDQLSGVQVKCELIIGCANKGHLIVSDSLGNDYKFAPGDILMWKKQKEIKNPRPAKRRRLTDLAIPEGDLQKAYQKFLDKKSVSKSPRKKIKKRKKRKKIKTVLIRPDKDGKFTENIRKLVNKEFKKLDKYVMTNLEKKDTHQSLDELEKELEEINNNIDSLKYESMNDSVVDLTKNQTLYPTKKLIAEPGIPEDDYIEQDGRLDYSAKDTCALNLSPEPSSGSTPQFLEATLQESSPDA